MHFKIMLIIIVVSMSCLFYRQERTHIWFQRVPLQQIWAVGVGLGLGISGKKKFRGRRNWRNKWLFPTEFRLFRGTEILGIPFGTLPRKRKQLGILSRRPKIEANSRNSLPNPSAEEKITRDSVPWNWNRSKLSELPSKSFSRRENSSEFCSVEQK